MQIYRSVPSMGRQVKPRITYGQDIRRLTILSQAVALDPKTSRTDRKQIQALIFEIVARLGKLETMKG